MKFSMIVRALRGKIGYIIASLLVIGAFGAGYMAQFKSAEPVNQINVIQPADNSQVNSVKELPVRNTGQVQPKSSTQDQISQPTPDLQLASLQTNLSKAEADYSEHLQQSVTFEADLKKSLVSKGYDLSTASAAIASKRQEFMRAMSEGDIETRDYEKVGRLSAELQDLLYNYDSMKSQLDSIVVAQRAKFDKEGELLKWKVEQAQNALNTYLQQKS